VGLYESRRASLREKDMEYVVSGIAAAFLFIYLMYALLRPEKF
jgi:K+-transporting ATPase KdpF subunit